MDRLRLFRQAIVNVMDDYIADHSQSESLKGLIHEKIIDTDNLRFQLVRLGWKDKQRIYNLIFHVDIIDNKIWVQEDNLEYSVAERLVDKGIFKKDIVLAYFTPFHRQHTEYAVS